VAVKTGLEAGQRAWALHGVSKGTAQLQARQGGAMVDFIDVRVEPVGLLKLGSLPASSDSPKVEAPYDEAKLSSAASPS
jgi:hypothetical protein